MIIQLCCYLLGPKSEGGRSDGGGEAETLDDLLPLLLVDDLHQAALLTHQVIQLKQVQHTLGHHW